MLDQVAGYDMQKRRASSFRNVKNRKNDMFDPTLEESLYLQN